METVPNYSLMMMMMMMMITEESKESLMLIYRCHKMMMSRDIQHQDQESQHHFKTKYFAAHKLNWTT